MMTERTEEAQPAPVSETAKPAGEIRARWAWVEPEVWTERMIGVNYYFLRRQLKLSFLQPRVEVLFLSEREVKRRN